MSFTDHQPHCCQQHPMQHDCGCSSPIQTNCNTPPSCAPVAKAACQPSVAVGLCVKPLCGVIAMPELDHQAMPVQGANVPNNNYYRRLIKQGKLQQIDCDSGEITQREWTGHKACSFSHLFKDQQVLNIFSLLSQSESGSPSVYRIKIDVKSSVSADGIMLVRGNAQDLLLVGSAREWQGHDDGIGNLSPATDFYLYLQDGDEVTISWDELA